MFGNAGQRFAQIGFGIETLQNSKTTRLGACCFAGSNALYRQTLDLNRSL
jgi:hypothetical protein